MASNSNLSVVLGDTELGVNMLIASGAQPKGVVIHNNVDHAIRLHEYLGSDSVIVLRMTGSESVIDNGFSHGNTPSEIGREWFNTTKPAMAAAPFAYFEVGGPGFNSDDPVYADFYADIIEDAMRRMYQEAYKGVVLCFYEGNPHTLSDGSGIDGWAPYWSVVTLAAAYGFILGPQGYWTNGKMDMADDWHNFRLLRVLRDYPGKFPSGTRFMKMEGGIDLRTSPPKGWKSSGCSREGFLNGLKGEDEVWETANLPADVEFICTAVFALHDEKGSDTMWPDFNFWEIYPELLDHIKSKQTIVEVPPEPEPEPATPGGMVAVRTKHPIGQWIRKYPSLNSMTAGALDRGEIGYVAQEEAISIGQESSWVHVQAGYAEGWCAAWLLERSK
jgi:hypothetical protein